MTPEAAVAKKIKVSDARASLGVTQKQLAERAGLVRKVVYKAERGLFVSRLSAHAILRALNVERSRQNLQPLGMEDLDIKIQGDSESEE